MSNEVGHVNGCVAGMVVVGNIRICVRLCNAGEPWIFRFVSQKYFPCCNGALTVLFGNIYVTRVLYSNCTALESSSTCYSDANTVMSYITVL